VFSLTSFLFKNFPDVKKWEKIPGLSRSFGNPAVYIENILTP